MNQVNWKKIINLTKGSITTCVGPSVGGCQENRGTSHGGGPGIGGGKGTDGTKVDPARGMCWGLY